jgi:hypothetical protein
LHSNAALAVLNCDIPRTSLSPFFSHVRSLSRKHRVVHLCATYIFFVQQTAHVSKRSNTSTMASSPVSSVTASLTRLLLLPCCGSSELKSRVKQRTAITPNVVCHQYERRLFLKPIMPATTQRQSRRGDDLLASVSEPDTDAHMGFGEGDERMSFPLPPNNLMSPTTTIMEDDSDEDSNAKMIGTETSSPHKANSLVDIDIEEDAQDISEAGTETLGPPNEPEVVDALHQSDKEDEGMCYSFCTLE